MMDYLYKSTWKIHVVYDITHEIIFNKYINCRHYIVELLFLMINFGDLYISSILDLEISNKGYKNDTKPEGNDY